MRRRLSTAVAVPHRVALLGSSTALPELRHRVALTGGQVVLELDPGVDGESHDRLDALVGRAVKEGGGIDQLVVLRAADAFSSLEKLLAGLRDLDARGIRFQSLEEPWLSGEVSAGTAVNGPGMLTAALDSRAARFLDLSIERLEADSRASAEQERRQEMQGEVGRVVAQLLLLAPYAVAVGIVSQAVLQAAILDPDLLLRRVRDLVSGSTAVTGEVTGAIPDALRGFVLSAIGSLVLLVFRGTSIGIRAELGGAIFMGLVTLSVYGLAAGFGTGVVGSLVALPGLALAVVVTFEFTHLVLRITSRRRPAEVRPRPAGGTFARIRGGLGELGTLARPTRSKALAAAFVAIPMLVVLVSVAAAATNGGWLFWPARIALFALAGWSAWACLSTPGAVRIPLWSMLGWAALLLLLSAATVVTAVFAVVIVLMLAVSVFELVFRHPGPGAARPAFSGEQALDR